MSLAADLAATHALAFAPERGWTEAEIDALLADPAIILSGTARSFVLGRIILDEAEVLTLATHPDHRRAGLARETLSDFETAAKDRGARYLFLEVAEDNGPARALYAQAGFDAVGKRAGYYARSGAAPVAALILRKTL
ncbi:GNAT family N-acetyltransferase [Loktanella sp. IMCC34160]|uniref:GNAT family N-acetyltransferase n=1 Tax=Loktanella sp. IMCC34160 TaxID=2510646 RepID=UPI00101BBB6B|nr:GNAT family N-acetyltransferase [Loktanella sp. IMCC34160]RYG92775.1 GNAT family N-acetyltransferase [Loktanella sp. IMCC34160]